MRVVLKIRNVHSRKKSNKSGLWSKNPKGKESQSAKKLQRHPRSTNE
jgi:hypothetical protein